MFLGLGRPAGPAARGYSPHPKVDPWCSVRPAQVDERTVRLQLWDTAGQCRFRSIIVPYIRGAVAVMLVYDINNRGSPRIALGCLGGNMFPP